MKPFVKHLHRRAFSLVEVLLAVFILGIGLIMVATVFPVGANWTRESTENTLAQTIAHNAVSIVKTYYDPANQFALNTHGKLSNFVPSGPSNSTSLLQALPNFTSIPVAERCYQFGSNNPYPASNPSVCLYYWTAMARLTPGQTNPKAHSYDLYIFVFRKGDAAQTFSTSTVNFTIQGHGSPSDIPLTHDPDTYTGPPTGYNGNLEPALVKQAYSVGLYSATGNPTNPTAVPPIGFIAVGETSGTVFQQAGTATGAVARPSIITAGENAIYALPADGTTASPLIYVFQTTISF